MATPKEILEKAFPGSDRPLLSYGLPHQEACRKHVDETFKASRVYIICSRTLAKTTAALADLQYALAPNVVGLRVGMSAPTLLQECLEVMQDVRRANADIIVTIGGGSLTDAGKIVTYALANDVETQEQLLELPHTMNVAAIDDLRNSRPSQMPFITIPTTLSGGEYSNAAGITDVITKQKYQFVGGLKGPGLVILPAELTTHTPLDTWLASGVRGVDHCVEALCTLQRPKDTKVWDHVWTAQIEGLQCLIPSLLRTKRDPSDADTRRLAQIGAKHAMVSLNNRVKKGASHAIGHALSPMGVEHGVTSCILMTPTHKYNAKANPTEQAAVREVLWSIPEGRDLFASRGLHEDTADLGDLLDVFIRELGLPRSLKEVELSKSEDIELVASNALKSPYAISNPIPLTSKDMVMAILEMCKE